MQNYATLRSLYRDISVHITGSYMFFNSMQLGVFGLSGNRR